MTDTNYEGHVFLVIEEEDSHAAHTIDVVGIYTTSQEALEAARALPVPTWSCDHIRVFPLPLGQSITYWGRPGNDLYHARGGC